MLIIRARPLGVWILSGVIAGQGLAHIAAGYDSLVPTTDDWPAALLTVVVGVLLLNKAWNMWRLHKIGWWVVVILASIGAVIRCVEIVRGHTGVATWVALGWAALTLVYLGSARIRTFFFA
jgi:hypothetical protein